MTSCKFQMLILFSSMQCFSALQQISTVLPGPKLLFQHLYGLNVDLLHAGCIISLILLLSCRLLVWISHFFHCAVSRNFSEQPQGFLQERTFSGCSVFSKQTNKMILSTGAFFAVLQMQWLWWKCINGAYTVRSASPRLLCWQCSLTLERRVDN